MKKTCKKTLCVILCALMIIPAALIPVFAEGEKCTCGNDPIILISGINTKNIVLDPGTDHEKVIFPPTSDQIVSTVKGAALPILQLLTSSDPNTVVDAFVDAVMPLFEEMSMNPDGTPKYNTGIDWSYPTTDNHKTGGEFEYCYDWRLDVHTLASGLNDYIEYVKKLTGHDKIKLEGFSMGAAVMDQYLVTYGYDDIDAVVYYSGAENGVAVCGEPFSGKIDTDPAALVSYLYDLMGEDDANKNLLTAVDVLYKTGILGTTVDGVLTLYNKIANKVDHEALIRTFGTMPGMWVLVGQNDYEDAKDIVFSTDEEKQTWSTLIANIDDYHYNVQAKVPEIMQNITEKIGVLGIVCKYGKHTTPALTDYNIQSDLVIDTHSESCGATCADLGSTLGDGYVQAVADGHDHVSADNVIDASTCLYPEYTWFIKGLSHSDTNADTEALVRYILGSKTQPTVWDNTSFPQFMYYDKTTDKNSALTAENAGIAIEKDPGTAYGLKYIIDWIFNIIKKIMSLIESIKAI